MTLAERLEALEELYENMHGLASHSALITDDAYAFTQRLGVILGAQYDYDPITNEEYVVSYG